MSVLDFIIIFVFVGSAIYGLWKGIVVQVGALAAVVVGILACRLFGPWATQVVAGFFSTGDASANLSHYIYSVIAYVTLFVIGYSLTRVLASFIKTVVNALFMGWIDRLLGALFSIFQWMLVLSVVLNVWQAASSVRSVASFSTIAGGRVASAILDLAPAVFGFAEFPDIF